MFAQQWNIGLPIMLTFDELELVNLPIGFPITGSQFQPSDHVLPLRVCVPFMGKGRSMLRPFRIVYAGGKALKSWLFPVKNVVQLCQRVSRERDIRCFDVVRHLIHPRRTRDHRTHPWLAQHPGERNL